VNDRPSIRTVLTVIVYAVAIYVGSAGLVPDPTTVWTLVPTASGTVLVIHAVARGILFASVGLGIVKTVVVARSDAIPGGRAVSLGATAVLVGCYALATGRANGEKVRVRELNPIARLAPLASRGSISPSGVFTPHFVRREKVRVRELN